MVRQHEWTCLTLRTAAWADVCSQMSGLGGPGPLMDAVNDRAQCATAVSMSMEAARTEISRKLILREVLRQLGRQ